MSAINAIGTAIPEFSYTKEQMLGYFQELPNNNQTEMRKLKSIILKSGIKTRHSILPDFGNKNSGLLFNKENQFTPSLEFRMDYYWPAAVELGIAAIRNCLNQLPGITIQNITHLITVSCTGMGAPGLDIALVKALSMTPNISRTSINFMGCYAALHALKIAKSIAAENADAVVLVVCVEICSIHFHAHNPEHAVLSNALFSDGAAAAVVSNKIDIVSENASLNLKSFYSELIFSGIDDMSWHPSSKGLLMKLSNYVPELIRKNFLRIAQTGLESSNLKVNEVIHWAIHPGGKKILDFVQEELPSGNNTLKESRKILENYGNMSSATILFVMKEFLDGKCMTENSILFAAAFGPGLTIETCCLQIV